ncbi:hypothetical protein TNCV_3213341 [Trichonephila clavipes]|nr:hypothetical protein TNCV_3213341 [Trichonephila clavipes]
MLLHYLSPVKLFPILVIRSYTENGRLPTPNCFLECNTQVYMARMVKGLNTVPAFGHSRIHSISISSTFAPQTLPHKAASVNLWSLAFAFFQKLTPASHHWS